MGNVGSNSINIGNMVAISPDVSVAIGMGLVAIPALVNIMAGEAAMTCGGVGVDLSIGLVIVNDITTGGVGVDISAHIGGMDIPMGGMGVDTPDTNVTGILIVPAMTIDVVAGDKSDSAGTLMNGVTVDGVPGVVAISGVVVISV